MKYLNYAIRDNIVKIFDDGKRKKITYLPINRTEIFSDPEEQVRAEYWSELIYRYQYEPEKIDIEVVIPDRTPSDRADIVVFHDIDRTRPYAVIECKKEGITDSEFEQAVEQVCGNGTWAKFRASYVMVVAGLTRKSFDFTGKYGVLEREKNIIADIPIRYGKPQEYKYFKGGILDIEAVSKEELISAIKKCHQTLWGGGKLSPPTAFSELCKLIFVKISDEQKKRKKDEPYNFQIKTHEPAKSLSQRIKQLYEEQQKKDPDVFTDTIKVSDGVLQTVVSHLEGINLSKTDLDTKGLAFEQFMDGFFKGDFGQYFTPWELIAFCTKVLVPTNDDIILDPACGSGGFLLHALDSVRNEANDYYPKDSPEHYKHWHDFAKQNLCGIEINDEIARVSKMNMILHDDGHTNVICFDSLENIQKINSINRNFNYDSFSLILTNPPFGAKIKLSEHPYLSNYFFGVKEKNGKKRILKNQKTEILFIEVVQRFLKKGTGRAAVILPDGILTNESLQNVRNYIFNNFQIYGVLSLPQTAFSHFGTSVKASIVFLRRLDEGEIISKSTPILMSTPEKIGYDSVGKKDENDLLEISSIFKDFIKSNHSFTNKIPYKEVDVSSFNSLDNEVLTLLGKSKIKIPDARIFLTTYKSIDGPINPERYRGVWREDIFDGHTLNDVCDLIELKTTPSKNKNTIYDLIRIDDLPNNPHKADSIRTLQGKDLTGSFFSVQHNDILLARLGPPILNKKIIICPQSINQMICSTEFHVLRVKKGFDPYAILCILRTNLYRDLMYSKGRGATPSRYRLIKSDLLKLPFPIIVSIQKQLSDIMKYRINKVSVLMDEVNKIWS